MGTEEESEYLKLSVEDRCVHKLWKARVSGYEESAKLFGRLDEEEVNDWKKYGQLMKKFVTDSNAIAQEKGLEAVLVFVENAPNAPKYAEPIADGLVTKGLGAAKTKTKESSLSILLMLCEVEAFEVVTAELIKGLNQKNPKVISGCINALKAVLQNFGVKVIKVSPILKATMPMLDHRDKGVREEGKQLIIEAYRWVGDLMKQQLSSLKPVQLVELEKEFEQVKEQSAPVKPLRLLRSQQLKMANNEGVGEEVQDEGDNADEDEEKIDPFDVMDAVNVVDQIPKNFYQLMDEKKWQLRKEALDALLPLVQTPKIENGDFNDLVRVLKRTVAKDANVVLVALAAQCLSNLAKGLRGSFKNHAASCLPVLLEKLKEKKQNVVTALVDALDNFYPILGIEAVQEDCFVALKHKTPAVNAITAKFLAKCFATCPPALQTNKKLLKGYVSVLSEKLTHSDVTVRDSSAEALAVLFKLMTEATITKIMPAEVASDTIKINKIKELMAKVELKGKRVAITAATGSKEADNGPKPIRGGAKKTTSSSAPGSDAPSATSKASSMSKSSKATDSSTTSKGGAAGGISKKPTASGSSKTSRTGAARSATIGGKKKTVEIDDSPLYHASDLKKTRFRDEAKLKVLKWNFSVPRQEFVELLQEQMTTANFNSTLVTQMFHSDFKQHLKALETLSQHVTSDPNALIGNLDLILKWSTLRFFETNPSVLLKTLDYLKSVFKLVSEQGYTLHEIEATSFIPYLVNKTGEPKDQMRAIIKAIIRLLGEVYPATKMSSFLLDGLKSKNAKQRAEVLDELSFLIKNHGSSVLQPSIAQNLKDIAKIIADRDNSVRNNAINCITEVYFQDGDKIYKAIGNLPEKDMSLLEERIKRASKTRPPPGSNTTLTRGSSQDLASKPPSATSSASNVTSSAAANAMMPPPAPSARTATFTRRQPVPDNKSVTDNTLVDQQQLHSRPPTTSRIGRPASGVFKLDLEKIESAVLDSTSNRVDSNSSKLPNLVKFPDLDAILNDQPVKLPNTSGQRFATPHKTTSSISNTPTPKKPPTTMADLSSSSEALAAVDETIASVRSSSTSVSISALSQLDQMFKDPTKISLMTKRVDPFLHACEHKLHLLASGSTESEDDRETMRLLQYLTVSLMTLYHHPEITRLAGFGALKGLVDSIIRVLVSQPVHGLSKSEHMIRHLNVLMSKIVDRSDCTNLSVALIQLMEEAHHQLDSSNAKYVELVMKCQWKVVQFIPTFINQVEDESQTKPLDISVVLASLHNFLKAFPSTFWKQQDSDMPFKTVKTIVHAFVKEKQEGIYDYLGLVEDPTASEMVPYIKKLVNSGVGKENQNHGSIASASRVGIRSKDHEKTLAAIFGKIGQKETTKEGLRELYMFKKSHPDADLEPFLAKASSFFRNYIESGLKNAAQDDKNSATTLTNGGSNNGDNGSSNGNNNQYMNRLRALREKAGLI